MPVPLLQFLCFFFLFFCVSFGAMSPLGPPLKSGRAPYHHTPGRADIRNLEVGLPIQHRTGGTAAFCDLKSGTHDEGFSDTKEENAQNVFTILTYPFKILNNYILKKKKKKTDEKEKKKIDGEKNISVPTDLSGSSYDNPSTPVLKSATEYYEKGITFKEKRLIGENESILDISFSRGRLYIPKLIIDNKTFDELRKQLGQADTKQKVTAYLQFWATFAREPEDVTLLSKKEIIDMKVNRANEVVDLIQNLYKDLVSKDLELVPHTSGESYLEPTCQQLDKYCRSMIWKWFVQSIRQFNPFFIIFSIIFKCATLLTVIYAILRYYKSTSDISLHTPSTLCLVL